MSSEYEAGDFDSAPEEEVSGFHGADSHGDHMDDNVTFQEPTTSSSQPHHENAGVGVIVLSSDESEIDDIPESELMSRSVRHTSHTISSVLVCCK